MTLLELAAQVAVVKGQCGRSTSV